MSRYSAGYTSINSDIDEPSSSTARSFGRNSNPVKLQHLRPNTRNLEDDEVPLRRNGESKEGLGKSASKPLVYPFDLFATITSIACCIAAVIVVANQYVAWRLGLTWQLVVVGFMLSIMQLCLLQVAPVTFLQLEYRFGPSRLQNYEALLRQRPLSPTTNFLWRVILTFLYVLPIGLSVAYKTFDGGSSSVTVHPSWPEYNREFGMYAAPGLQPLGTYTGAAFLVNATTPVIQASRANLGHLNSTVKYHPSMDPPLPAFPAAYGVNTLLVEETEVAMLDLPPPSWVASMQSELGENESLNISSIVLASVAKYNPIIEQHRNPTNSSWWNHYSSQSAVGQPEGSDGTRYSPLYNGYDIVLMTNYDFANDRNESWTFIGIAPSPPDAAGGTSLELFAPNASLYTTSRRPCKGTWTITQAGMQLVEGHCSESLPFPLDEKNAQLVFTSNLLTIPDYYLGMLNDNLGQFTTVRNESRWLTTMFSTNVAAMMWARATGLDGPGSSGWPMGMFIDADGNQVFANQSQLLYEQRAEMTMSRPTLHRSGWLYFIFVIQPVLTVGLLLGRVLLYSVPVGRGFSLVAVLAGVDKGSLGIIQGAGFSGELSRPVKLAVSVDEIGAGVGRMKYCVGESVVVARSKIRRQWRYS